MKEDKDANNRLSIDFTDIDFGICSYKSKDQQDQFDDAGTYGCSLIFEAIGYKEGDTLELHCGDQVLTIK